MSQGTGYLLWADVANPGLIDAKPKACQSGGGVRLVFREGLWLMLIRAAWEKGYKMVSSQMLQLVSRKEQKCFLKDI